jgi:hypothetical protein
MLPIHCSVRITNEDDDLHGQVGFIHTQPGDETIDGVIVPEGWYELALDPWENGFSTELYREENIEICGC